MSRRSRVMERGQNDQAVPVSTSRSSEVEVAAVRVRLVRLDQAAAEEVALWFVVYTMPMPYQLR